MALDRNDDIRTIEVLRLLALGSVATEWRMGWLISEARSILHEWVDTQHVELPRPETEMPCPACGVKDYTRYDGASRVVYFECPTCGYYRERDA